MKLWQDPEEGLLSGNCSDLKAADLGTVVTAKTECLPNAVPEAASVMRQASSAPLACLVIDHIIYTTYAPSIFRVPRPHCSAQLALS